MGLWGSLSINCDVQNSLQQHHHWQTVTWWSDVVKVQTQTHDRGLLTVFLFPKTPCVSAVYTVPFSMVLNPAEAPDSYSCWMSFFKDTCKCSALKFLPVCENVSKWIQKWECNSNRDRNSRCNGEVGSRQWADFSHLLGFLQSDLLTGSLLFLLFILQRERERETAKKREIRKEIRSERWMIWE